MVRAVALVGFYRGDLVVPGQIIEVGDSEFFELLACNKVARDDRCRKHDLPAPVRKKAAPTE
jgi:hypothetical protein